MSRRPRSASMMTSESRRTPATAGGDGLGAYRGGAASRTRWWGRYRCGLAIDPRSHGVSRHARPRRRRRLAPGRREPTRRSYVPADAPGLEDDGGRTRRDRAAYGPYDVYTSLGRVRQRLALTDVQDGEAHLGEETRRRRQQPVSVFDSTGAAQEAAQAEIAGGDDRSHRKSVRQLARLGIGAFGVIGGRALQLGLSVGQRQERRRFIASLFLTARQLDRRRRRAERSFEAPVEPKRLGQARPDRALPAATDNAGSLGGLLDERDALARAARPGQGQAEPGVDDRAKLDELATFDELARVPQ